ncbi:MAG: hypothetical protein ABSA57_12205 [Candidatus Acidiferrales bacterium]
MTAHDRDTAISGLLRQSLQADTVAQGQCPGPDILAAYYERSLGSDELPCCELHVSQCSRCREQLALMVRAEAPLPAEPRHGWLLDWRLLLSAATALLILTVGGLHRPVSKLAVDRTATRPLVAISRSEQSAPPQPPQPSASVLALRSGAAGESRSKPELDRVSPQPRASRVEAPGVMQKTPSGDLSFDGSEAARDADSLKLGSEQQAGGQSNRLSEPKVRDLKSAATPTPIVPGPAVGPQLAAPESATNASAGVGARTMTSGAVIVAPAELPKAKQPPQGLIVGELGAASGRSLAQSAEQRSVQTIIPTPDPKVLWRIAGGGFIERSEDSGATWRGQLPESNAHFTAGAAPTTKALWLVGENGLILLTKDGSHWKEILPPIPADFVSVDAKSASSATVIATGGQKFSTSDSGKKWVPAP